MERMDRQTVIKMGGFGGAAVFLGGKSLGEPFEAEAMNSRFDGVLRLVAGGAVVASGPTGFASDERRARIYAHVAQAGRVQTGNTLWVSGPTWSKVLSGPKLKAGPADAYGTAYVENRDGSYEWYSWRVAVTLR